MSFTLVDIALVDVVVPLDVVQKGCGTDPANVEHTGKKKKRLVFPRRDTPQKRDHRSPPKHVNLIQTHILEAPTLLGSCACKPWDGEI
jgi:hypothetical protein